MNVSEGLPRVDFSPNPNNAVKSDPLQPERCARKLAALAAPERLRIIHFLRDGPRNVSQIAEMLKAPLVNVSHHMHVLAEAGLVQRQKKGRFVLYSLIPGLLELEEQGDCCQEHLNLGCCRLELPIGKKRAAKDL
jgi:DNA-binding transcriptional ArsR family regulator